MSLQRTLPPPVQPRRNERVNSTATGPKYISASAPRGSEGSELCELRIALASLHGVDLTASSMRAYHDGGPHHGEVYDSDFGGAMYADGDEGLRIPPIDPAMYERARLRDAELFERARRGRSAPR